MKVPSILVGAALPKLLANISGDANTVDGVHAGTSAAADILLALNASAKLPASITGDADTVDSIHAATSATANKLLPLNASAKLPASITGDSDTVDGKHANELGGVTIVAIYHDTDSTFRGYTKGAWRDCYPSRSLSLTAGDIVLVVAISSLYSATDNEDVRYRIAVGSNYSGEVRAATHIENTLFAMAFVYQAASTTSYTTCAQVYSTYGNASETYGTLTILHLR